MPTPNDPGQDAQGRAEPSTPNDATETKPLPKGYLWRLMVILPLLLGGCWCLLFVNSLLGLLLTAAGMAFGKLSGMNAMLDDLQSDSRAPRK